MSLSVRYFRTSRGEQPVQDYLERVSEKDSARIFALLQELARRGLLSMPHGKKFSGHSSLYEIRYRRHRVIYCVQNGVVILLHAFLKKTQATPQKEFNLALERQKAFKEAENGHA